MVWDESKRVSNLRPPPEGHGLDFIDARDRFAWEKARIFPTYPSRTGRARFMAVGYLDDVLVALVFSPLGNEAVSVVSLRIASRKERKAYDEG